MGGVTSMRISRLVNASTARVYDALVDPAAVARRRVPAGMTCEVHEFDAREGGVLRVSLTYDAPHRSGKAAARTDTYHEGLPCGLSPADEEVGRSEALPRPAALVGPAG